MKLIPILLEKWWATRYVPESVSILDSLDSVELDDNEKSDIFLDAVLDMSKREVLKTSDPRFIDYSLPEQLLKDNQKVREIVVNRIRELKSSDYSWEDTKGLLIDNHENVKRLQNRWFAANPGLLLEFIQITDDYPKKLVDWLDTQGLKVGDDTIHLHVISNGGRRQIKDMGFDVPFDHWDKSYFLDMLEKVKEVLKLNPKVKGFFVIHPGYIIQAILRLLLMVNRLCLLTI